MASEDTEWFTVRQVVIAWIQGMVEQANQVEGTKFYLPRYLETVGDQLARHLRDRTHGDIFEARVADVAGWLKDFTDKHAVVQEWDFSVTDGVVRAVRYLQYQVTRA